MDKQLESSVAKVPSVDRDFEEWKLQRGYHWSWKLESFKTANQFSTSALRGAFLINGAALIGLLTFLGNLWAKFADDARKLAASMVLAALFYGLGLVAAVVASGVSYLSQPRYTKVFIDDDTIATRFKKLAICLFSLSIALFCIGAAATARAFLNTAPTP